MMNFDKIYEKNELMQKIRLFGNLFGLSLEYYKNIEGPKDNIARIALYENNCYRGYIDTIMYPGQGLSKFQPFVLFCPIGKIEGAIESADYFDYKLSVANHEYFDVIEGGVIINLDNSIPKTTIISTSSIADEPTFSLNVNDPSSAIYLQAIDWCNNVAISYLHYADINLAISYMNNCQISMEDDIEKREWVYKFNIEQLLNDYSDPTLDGSIYSDFYRRIHDISFIKQGTNDEQVLDADISKVNIKYIMNKIKAFQLSFFTDFDFFRDAYTIKTNEGYINLFDNFINAAFPELTYEQKRALFMTNKKTLEDVLYRKRKKTIR